jgi:hypothetical protein
MLGNTPTLTLISGQKYESTQTPSRQIAANQSDLFTASHPNSKTSWIFRTSAFSL